MSEWKIDFGLRRVTRLSDGVTGAADDRDPLFSEYTAWLLEGGTPIVENTEVLPIPESVPSHHLRRALTAAGLRQQIEALISALPVDHAMRDDWEYAPTIRRDAQGIESVRAALGLTEAQVDDVFRAAGNQST
jgi:hypothetical protein